MVLFCEVFDNIFGMYIGFWFKKKTIRINYIVKTNDLYNLFEQSVTKNKYGNFQINYNLQLVSKIVKLIDKNNGAITYKKALEQIIIAKNYNNLNK